jgi:protein SCO1/2
MLSLQRNIIRKHFRTEFAFLILLAGMSYGIAGCSKPAPTAAPAATADQSKRYHLVGKVVSIDQQQASVMVDGQEITGFMSAMTMPYPVHDAKALAALTPGDEITADVVVAPDGAYLENIVVTKKAGSSSTAQPAGSLHTPQPGDKVPDFALVNQDGKRIHLSSFHGNVLLVTFIYTRCPFPDFCPYVSKNFAQIYAALRKNPALQSKIQLLSVSFDPAYDTPAVLRKYGQTFRQTTGGDPFDRWEFAAVPATELPKVADFFGLDYSSEAGKIVHSLSTTVISPEGTVYKWYEDNDWKAADLLTDAAQALQQANAESHTLAHVPNA